MKKLTLTGFAAVMLVACSIDDVVEQNPQNAIVFEQSYVENMTKANDFNSQNVPASLLFCAIQVPGGDAYYSFDKQLLNADGTYTPVQYWKDGATYTFTAFAPYDVASSLVYSRPEAASVDDQDRGTLVFNNKTQDGDVDLMKAICAQFTYDKLSTSKSVALNFKHQLSRLRFKFNNEMDSDAYQIKISGLQIVNAVEAVTLNVATGADINSPSTFALAFNTKDGEGETAEEVLIGNYMSLETDHKYLIPNTGDLKIEFVIQLFQKDAEGKSHLVETFNFTGENAVVLPAFEMKKGLSYRLSVKFNHTNINPDNPEGMDEIKFDVTVDDWADWTDQTIE